MEYGYGCIPMGGQGSVSGVRGQGVQLDTCICSYYQLPVACTNSQRLGYNFERWSLACFCGPAWSTVAISDDAMTAEHTTGCPRCVCLCVSVGVAMCLREMACSSVGGVFSSPLSESLDSKP